MQPTDVSWWEKYGLLGVGIFVFGGVIAFLFKLLIALYSKKLTKAEHDATAANDLRAQERENFVLERTRWDLERTNWELERERLRTEYAGKERELADKLGREVRDIYKDAQDREDAVRREFAELMETVSEKYTKASEAIIPVLNKFYDRFVGPRARRGG